MISPQLTSSRHRVARPLTFWVLFGLLSTMPLQADSFELRDSDRVAFLGDTFFEQAIRYGHIETALSSRWPDRKILFRNIGWAGDSPEGRARAFFDPLEKGFENLKMHIELANPTVVILSYGSMAAYEGKAGLSSFIDKMNILIDTIEEGEARIAILSPTPREFKGLQLPNPEAQNRELSSYVDALRSLAENRGAFFVDLFNTLETSSRQRETKAITANGIHLNEYGYFLAAERIAQAFSGDSTAKSLSLGKNNSVSEATGIKMIDAKESEEGIALRLQDQRLSLSPLSGDYSQNLKLALANLPRGNYELIHEGKVLATGSAQNWKRGIQLAWEPSNDRARLLREAINRKNRHFFHQWRPQNETYLRGFRKHEQGQNAAEIPLYDKFIDMEESKIDALKKPQAYTLTLKRVKGGEG